MLNIETLTLGAYQTNTYLVWASDAPACAVIDPGYEADTILRRVAQLGLTVDAVLLTHGHFDHVGAVEQIVNETGCALWMNEGDHSLPPDPVTAYFYPLANCALPDVQFMQDGRSIRAGGTVFRALHTPGHTRGSMCLLCEDALFSGDTLFAGSRGRTDLPGGSEAALLRSLERLAALEGDYRVFPGHGAATTLRAEKRYNPYMPRA